MLTREAARASDLAPAGPGRLGAGSSPGRLRSWLLACRPRTLSVAVVPVLAGSATAWSANGQFDPGVALAALVAAILIQIGTNLHNDVADAARGADEPGTRLGPPRATAEGWLPAAAVRRGAVTAFGLAVLVGAWLVTIGGWPILLVGLASIAAGVAYTGGRRPLGYMALGEVCVWAFFGVIAVAGTHYLLTGTLAPAALVAGALLGLPAAAVLVVNNYRDLDADRRIGKQTLAVRIGRRATRVEYGLLMLAPFPFLHLVAPGAGWTVLLPWACLPWGLALVRRFATEPPGPSFNSLLAATARYQLVLGVLLAAAVVLA